MENVLKKIINKKKERIKIYKKEYPENKLFEDIKNINNFIDFKDKIKRRNAERKISIIAEIKKASPSAGEIIKNFNPLNIAKIYFENGASFLSVLTEEYFFLGKLDYIKNIKSNYKIPILCKDFFIDTYQVALAKSFGADCILIILSAVALSFKDSLIGINNRNLKTLEVSLNTSVKLSKILNSHQNPLICESGIHSTDNIKFIIDNAGIYNFLIGESLLKSQDIKSKLKQFTQISL